MPAINFRELKASISMDEVLMLLEFVPTSRSGPQVRGACPIHDSKGQGRSFSVHLVRRTLQCFKCGAAGNHIDLWAKATHQTIYAAAVDLCQRLNRGVPWLTSGPEKRNQ